MSDEKAEAGSVCTKGCAGETALTEGTKQSRDKRKLVKKKIMKQMSLGMPNGVLGTIPG